MHYQGQIEIASQFQLRIEKLYLLFPVQAGNKAIQTNFTNACKLWVAN